MAKATDIQYPMKDLSSDEKAITDSMVQQLTDIINLYRSDNKIPLRDVVKIMGDGPYVIVHLQGTRDTNPDLETIIKEIVPHAIVKHADAIRERDQENIFSGSIRIIHNKLNIDRRDLFTSRLGVFINEKKEIVLLRGKFFSPGTRFTI